MTWFGKRNSQGPRGGPLLARSLPPVEPRRCLPPFGHDHRLTHEHAPATGHPDACRDHRRVAGPGRTATRLTSFDDEDALLDAIMAGASGGAEADADQLLEYQDLFGKARQRKRPR